MQGEQVQRSESKKALRAHSEEPKAATEIDFVTVEQLERQQLRLLRRQQFVGKAISKYQSWRDKLTRRSDKLSKGVLQYAEVELRQWRELALKNEIKLKQMAEQLNQLHGRTQKVPRKVNYAVKRPKRCRSQMI